MHLLTRFKVVPEEVQGLGAAFDHSASSDAEERENVLLMFHSRTLKTPVLEGERLDEVHEPIVVSLDQPSIKILVQMHVTELLGRRKLLALAESHGFRVVDFRAPSCVSSTMSNASSQFTSFLTERACFSCKREYERRINDDMSLIARSNFRLNRSCDTWRSTSF